MEIRTILRAALIGSMLSSTPALAEDLNIAVVGPMTGPIANIGDQSSRAPRPRPRQSMRNAGVNGRQINLSIEDDACDPKQAVSVANRIAAGGIKFVAEAVCDAHPYTGRDLHLEMRQVPLAG